ncbi:MAG: bifunctional methylenetetrahydrofolate dehydrogenase/methenyltetrahydrofolate cyclohydrolase FolD [Euryarchaeota archaeon]|nr:bifunctional methylenetetrahydrofolate dehydrogenase/methenyltetrahydrofolate cyclohydrolase FolD [Euryarchaeota archaeon]
MGANRLDGKVCAAKVESSLSSRIRDLAERGSSPHLAVVIVGDDPASHVYVRSKERACERLGIRSTRIDLPAAASFDKVLATVESLNQDPDVDGILVQSPLPRGMDELAITDHILPEKDVDGFHPVNLGRLVQGRLDGLLPCTPAGVMYLLKFAELDLTGLKAVVLGRSRIVGMPMALLLAAKGADATVTVVHSRTTDIESHCRGADLIVAAVGRPEMVKAAWVKTGAIIVDVGINRVEDSSVKGYRLCGDVEEDANSVASYMTPVPGGVGPMTIAMLMSNTVRAAEMRKTS